MESSGNNRDLNGKIVNQGIAVFGNKGSTEQHSYFQQLREGVLNFCATFIEVFTDRAGKSMFVEPEVMSGDYLEGFLLGTRRALHKNGREFITITIKSVSPFSVLLLIAFSNMLWVFTPPRSRSTPVISQVLKPAKKPPPPSSTFNTRSP